MDSSKIVRNIYINGDLGQYNRGTIYLQNNKPEKALQCFRREKDSFKELYLNMGNAYRYIGAYDKARDYYLLANSPDVLDLDGVGGEYPSALGNLGLLAYMVGEDADAGWFCNRALVLDPLHAMTIWNFSLVLLREYCSGGQLHKDAWKMHEYRFRAVKEIEKMPWWDGVSKVSGPLVVLNEQGMGDKIMYGRYLKKLSTYCDSLVVQCPVEMNPLFNSMGYKTLNGPASIDYTVGIPFGVLPRIFGEVSEDWLGSYEKPKNNRFKVYVEWAGSASHINNKNRSCFAGYFAALAKKFPLVEFVNARPDAERVRGIKALKSVDWGNTVDIIRGCDLVISVDTSIVHLAGTLGIETWMMQPLYDTDFRWGNPKTKKLLGIDPEWNLWYKSVRVLENNGWEQMFDEIGQRLRNRTDGFRQLLALVEEKIAKGENLV